MHVQLLVSDDISPCQLKTLTERWGIQHCDGANLALVLTSNRLEVRDLKKIKQGGIWVNFVSNRLTYRRKFSTKQSEALVRAVGVCGDYLPYVVDATAGLGRDAFILSAIGCRVCMLERHPVVAALLDDGLHRGYSDENIGYWLRDRLTLKHTSIDLVLPSSVEYPQVVYLDPMYPNLSKRTLVKKEMQVFRQLVGIDADADALLTPARLLATQRVVVKRPRYAKFLANISPHGSIFTRNCRFDIYMPLK